MRSRHALFVTWDEGTDDAGADVATGSVVPSGGGGQVLTLVVPPALAAGEHIAIPYHHYSLLRTIEDSFGLPLLAGAAAPGVHALGAFWAGTSSSARAG